MSVNIVQIHLVEVDTPVEIIILVALPAEQTMDQVQTLTVGMVTLAARLQLEE
jgi:hypothetical protein